MRCGRACRDGRGSRYSAAAPCRPSHCRRAGSGGRADRSRLRQRTRRCAARGRAAGWRQAPDRRQSAAPAAPDDGCRDQARCRSARRRRRRSADILRLPAVRRHRSAPGRRRGSARGTGRRGSAAMRSSVAGASTSQNAASAPGRLIAGTRASSSASKTPTPLALTIRSALRALSSARSTPARPSAE